jgi:hypothetical protein
MTCGILALRRSFVLSPSPSPCSLPECRRHRLGGAVSRVCPATRTARTDSAPPGMLTGLSLLPDPHAATACRYRGRTALLWWPAWHAALTASRRPHRFQLRQRHRMTTQFQPRANRTYRWSLAQVLSRRWPTMRARRVPSFAVQTLQEPLPLCLRLTSRDTAPH